MSHTVHECRSPVAIEFDRMESVMEANQKWLDGRASFYLEHHEFQNYYSIRPVFAYRYKGLTDKHVEACEKYMRNAQHRMGMLTCPA